MQQQKTYMAFHLNLVKMIQLWEDYNGKDLEKRHNAREIIKELTRDARYGHEQSSYCLNLFKAIKNVRNKL